MSDSPARTVYARPPGKRTTPRRSTSAKGVAPAAPSSPCLTSSAAITAFLDLVHAWKLPPARGWRMLTGLGYRAGSLTSDQIVRVQHLVAIDAGVRTIMGDAVGDWMVTCNGPDMMSGAAPVDFLTRKGTSSYAALAGQVAIWAQV